MTDKQQRLIDNLLALLRIVLNILMCVCILGVAIYFTIGHVIRELISAFTRIM